MLFGGLHPYHYHNVLPSHVDMKLIAVSDIHGSYKTTESLLRSEWPWDGLIMAGDLTTHGSEKETSSALDMLRSFGAPVAGVCGNMDAPEMERVFLEKGISIDRSGTVWGDVGLFGVSGSLPTPMHTPYEISEQEIAARVRSGWNAVRSARHTILVSHTPPFNTTLDVLNTGRHVGSSAVRSFIESERPTLVICGHIHEARGIDSIGPTTIVNCGPAGMGYYAVVRAGDSVTIELKG